MSGPMLNITIELCRPSHSHTVDCFGISITAPWSEVEYDIIYYRYVLKRNAINSICCGFIVQQIELMEFALK